MLSYGRLCAAGYIKRFTSRMKGGVRAAKRIISPYSKARRASALNTHGVFIQLFPCWVISEDLPIDKQALFHLVYIFNIMYILKNFFIPCNRSGICCK